MWAHSLRDQANQLKGICWIEAGRVEGTVVYGPPALFQSSPCESTDYENKTKVLFLDKDDNRQ